MIAPKLKSGFGFIEIIIGLAVSTILMSFLFTIYNHVGQSGARIEKITKMDSKIMIFRDRFQKDLNGLVPLSFTKEIYKKIKSKAIKPDQQEWEQHDPDEAYGAFFYSENQENSEQFDILTFVTNNYLKSFEQSNKSPQRVVYTLKKDPSNPKYSKFLRKEIDNSSANFKKQDLKNNGKFYEILNNILDFYIEYQFIDQKDENNKPDKQKKQQSSEKDKKSKNPDKSQPATYKSLKDWGVVNERTETTGYKPTLPEFIKIKLKIEEQKKINEYELIFEIPVKINGKPVSFAQKREKDKKHQPGSNQVNKNHIDKKSIRGEGR